MIAEMMLRVFVSPAVAVREGSSRSGVGVFPLSDVLPMLTAEERARVADALHKIAMVDTFGIGAATGDVYDLRAPDGERAPLPLDSSRVCATAVAQAVRVRLAAIAEASSGAAPN